MKVTYNRALTLDELAALPDNDIDTSDIPELDESFWNKANVVLPSAKQAISLRLPPDVLAYFKEKNPTGFTSHMAAVLAAYVAAQSKG